MLISFLPFQLGIGDLLYEILYFFLYDSPSRPFCLSIRWKFPHYNALNDWIVMYFFPFLESLLNGW